MKSHKIALFLSFALSMQGVSAIAPEPIVDAVAPLAAVSESQPSKVNHVFVRIHDSVVQARKDALKSERFYNNITRIGTKSLAAIAVLYVVYGYVSPWFSTTPKPALVPGVIPEDLVPRFQVIEGIVNPETFTWQWFKSYGKNLFNGFIVGSAVHATSAVAADAQKRIFHPDSFEWFVQNKTNLFDLLPFQLDPRSLMNGFPAELQMHMIMLKNQDRIKKSTIEELREHITALEGFESYSSEQQSMALGLVTSTANSLVASLEAVLGFMALKQESACDAIAQEIDAHIRYIINSTNLFCDKLTQVLENTTLDGQKKKQECISALSSFKGELHRICMRFVAIEREQGI